MAACAPLAWGRSRKNSAGRETAALTPEPAGVSGGATATVEVAVTAMASRLPYPARVRADLAVDRRR